MSTWKERWYEELEAPRNRYIALPGHATLGQALALLRSPQVNDATDWHLLVARSDGNWAFARVDALLAAVQSEGEAALDRLLDDVPTLQSAQESQIIDLSKIGIGEAGMEAQTAQGKLLLMLDGEELAGILYVGTERSAKGVVSTSVLNELAGRYADLSEFSNLLIKPRRPRPPEGQGEEEGLDTREGK